MKPLQELLREVVAPVLRAQGFTRSGGTFRKVTHVGVAVVQVSGRGRIGLTDLDFGVTAGFTLLSDLHPPRTPEQVVLAHGANTWSAMVDDPAMPPYFGHSWLFNEANTAARECFAAVLERAAADVLHRLEIWPSLPQDSFSQPPVFLPPVTVGERPEHVAYWARMHAAMGRDWAGSPSH